MCAGHSISLYSRNWRHRLIRVRACQGETPWPWPTIRWRHGKISAILPLLLVWYTIPLVEASTCPSLSMWVTVTLTYNKVTSLENFRLTPIVIGLIYNTPLLYDTHCSKVHPLFVQSCVHPLPPCMLHILLIYTTYIFFHAQLNWARNLYCL